MNNYILAAVTGATLSLVSFGAQALPIAASEALTPVGIVDHVAQGCGPGMARGPMGGCRPMRGGMGRMMGARRCFVRPTPFGPRRVCR